MKKSSILQKIASGKGFYVTVAISFCLIIFAVSLIYRTSTDMLRGILTVPEEITQQARGNETDEADPRYEPDTEITLPSHTVPTQEITEASEPHEKLTTEKATQAAIVNESYVLPAGSDIIRDFSADVPTYDKTMGDWRTHKGIDFYCEAGTEVKSVGNGRVVRVIADKSYGYVVEIDHGDFIARYCGLSQEDALRLGDTVSKGDKVGSVYSIPCEAAEESHLHFEVTVNGVATDPLEAMKMT